MFCVLVYLLIHVTLRIREKGCSFFSNLWNILELTSLLMLATTIGLYIGCVIEATNIFKEFSLNTGGYFNFETVSDVHTSLRYTQAWLLFLLMIKVGYRDLLYIQAWLLFLLMIKVGYRDLSYCKRASPS